MSFAAVAVVAAVASAGIAAYSSYEQSQAQQAQLDYQAEIDIYNAQIAQNNADTEALKRSDALQRGEEEARQSMRQRAALLGKQRASLAANGIDLTEGTALDVFASTEFLGKEDVATIQNNAARQAWGYDINQGNFQSQSNLDRFGASSKIKTASSINPGLNAGISGASSLLSSASTYSSRVGFGKAKK